ncbi:hypothetical protein [Pseudomonas sp. NFR16]|uniref:hypothetical protein n=1 Tax=Pseudomonas sp. NFR16 TaxID=1566248 RepID=UPI0008BC0D0D|nr:hypothetical protein [Pseudomonas sp. NFR16]SEJ77911.1 hypothetical protein SAMN03159495_4491 [Pseudomonas sp. NFR16]
MDFRNFILESTHAHYGKTGQALLLAAIGHLASAQGIKIRDELNGVKLTKFITDHLSDELDIVQSNTDRLVFGVVPKGQSPADPALSTTMRPPEFPLSDVNRALQAAFLRPIKHERTRYVLTQPTLSYVDVAAGQTPPLGGIALEGTFLPTPEQAANPVILRSFIERFANAYQIEIGYVRNPRGPLVDSLLSKIVECLTDDELARVSIPLDIVAKLMRK